MAKAKKLPSGQWRTLLYTGIDDTGKRVYKSFTADTKKESEYMAAEYNYKRKAKPKQITVGDAIDNYIAIKENVLSPTTISGYRGIRRNYFKSLMGLALDKVTSMQIQNVINIESKTLAPKTLKNTYGLLISSLKMYMPDFSFTVTLPAKKIEFKQLPSADAVINAAQGTEIELAVIISMWLSLRLSEVTGLKYTDIKNDVLCVQRAKFTLDRKEVVREQTKTSRSTRLLQLPQHILDLIEKSKDENCSKDDFIIKISPKALSRRFSRLMQHNDITMKFHDLRHLNASVMVMLGVPDKYAMERGGWATDNILKSVYQHTFSAEREVVDKKINDYFENLIKKE